LESGTTTLFTSIGYAAVVSNLGSVVAEQKLASSMTEEPMLYYSMNTTAIHNTFWYNIDGEQSWSVLEKIEATWPSYIPKVTGTYTFCERPLKLLPF